MQPTTAPDTDPTANIDIPPPPRDRAAINRENAQHSTGPKTPEGKCRIKFNALRHGACAVQIVLPGEDQAAFDELGKQLTNYWRPSGDHEIRLVSALHENHWRAARLRAAETNLLSLGAEEQMHKFDHYEESVRLAFAQAASLRANARYLDQISRHESRILKQIAALEIRLSALAHARRDAEEAERLKNLPRPSYFGASRPTRKATPKAQAAPTPGFVMQDTAPENAEASKPAASTAPPAPDRARAA